MYSSLVALYAEVTIPMVCCVPFLILNAHRLVAVDPDWMVNPPDTMAVPESHESAVFVTFLPSACTEICLPLRCDDVSHRLVRTKPCGVHARKPTRKRVGNSIHYTRTRENIQLHTLR